MHNIHPALKEACGAVEVADVFSLPFNPRIGDIQKIKRSLTRFGQVEPLLVAVEPHPESPGDEPVMVVHHGNHRLRAARELGWTHVAVLDVSDMTDDERKALALAMNRTADSGHYDTELLVQMVEELNDRDVELLHDSGWDPDAVDMLLGVSDWTPLGPAKLEDDEEDDDDESTWWPTLSLRVPNETMTEWNERLRELEVEPHELLADLLS